MGLSEHHRPRAAGDCNDSAIRCQTASAARRAALWGEGEMREKAIVSWSGGKDSALALYEVAAEYDIAALLTTVTSEYERISMHGVRTRLLEQQAAALNYPLEQVPIPPQCVNADYESRMGAALARY